jgi:hypothetical protein
MARFNWHTAAASALEQDTPAVCATGEAQLLAAAAVAAQFLTCGQHNSVTNYAAQPDTLSLYIHERS